MSVIEQGNVITGGVVLTGTGPRSVYGEGVPTGKYADVADNGDLYVDTLTDHVYENSGTLAVPVWGRIDTIPV